MKIRGLRIGVKQVRMLLGMPGQEKSNFNRCVGSRLLGKRGDRATRQANFKAATGACKGTRG